MVKPIIEFGKIKDIQDYLYSTNKRDYLLFVTGINTGLRISDILKLRVKDVRGKSEIKLRMTKTKKTITVEINGTLKKQYKKVLDDSYNDNDYLIKSRNGFNKPICRERAYRILKEVGLLYGVKNVGCHSMRKTFGYYLFETSGKIEYVQKALGHSNTQVTYRYIGLEDEELRQHLNNLGLPE